jgi:hypothetical protein
MKPFITTYTGRKVNPLALEVSDIDTLDIVHHLACINRFVGALREPINVAQHSYYVGRLVVGTGWEREALFHDATEAYLGDVSKWVKQMACMDGYREAEDRAWNVICKALDLRPSLDACVEEADRLMVRYEADRLATNTHMFELATHPRPTQEEIFRVGEWHPWNWGTSKFRFQMAVERGLW